jgi:hypothetical protein
MREDSDDGGLYRVPVRRVAVTLTLQGGARRDVTLFLGNDEGIGAPLAGDRPFFPADDAGQVRLYAVAAVVSVSAMEILQAPEPCERAIRARVHLRCGGALEGEIRFIPSAGKARLVDALSEDAPTLVVREPERVHHVQKAHVLFVEELLA